MLNANGADLGDLAAGGCEDNTGADDLHHLSSRAAKGLELSQRALVQGVQGSLCLLDDRLSSSQVPGALLSKGCDFSLCKDVRFSYAESSTHVAYALQVSCTCLTKEMLTHNGVCCAPVIGR